jgi:hypothetical protein
MGKGACGKENDHRIVSSRLQFQRHLARQFEGKFMVSVDVCVRVTSPLGGTVELCPLKWVSKMISLVIRGLWCK